MIIKRTTGLLTVLAMLCTLILCGLAASADVYAAASGSSSSALKAPVIKSSSRGSDWATVKWSKVSGAEGYQIYRCVDTGSYSRVKTTTGRTYNDTGLTYKTMYTYKIRAYKTKNSKRVYGSFSEAVSLYTGKVNNPKWAEARAKYAKDTSVNYLVFVRHTSGSEAKIVVYGKNNGSWKRVYACKGWVGQNGIDKVKEGDKKTPTGTFGILGAFGIQSKPETSLPYQKVNKYLYWCGDSKYYNTLVDIRKKPHKCSGEHLIDYKGAYDYGFFLDFNPDCIQGKGSAIFFHCTTNYAYTAGCISVAKTDMLKILSLIDINTKVCIYESKVW